MKIIIQLSALAIFQKYVEMRNEYGAPICKCLSAALAAHINKVYHGLGGQYPVELVFNDEALLNLDVSRETIYMGPVYLNNTFVADITPHVMHALSKVVKGQQINGNSLISATQRDSVTNHLTLTDVDGRAWYFPDTVIGFFTLRTTLLNLYMDKFGPYSLIVDTSFYRWSMK